MKLDAYLNHGRGLAIVVLLLLGCVSNGPETVIFSENSERIGTFPEPVFMIDGLSPKDKEILGEAYAALMLILGSDSFKIKLNNKKLRAGCLSDARVDGDRIITDLKTKTIPVVIQKRKSRYATAMTDIVKRRMYIDPNRFDNWHTGKADQSIMINTLMHEITHLIPYDKETPVGKNWYYKYYDQGHNNNGCLDADLVSYVVGNVAQDVWLELP